jgi:transposase
MRTAQALGSRKGKGKRRLRTDNRHFLHALLWQARSGSRWRDLPEWPGRHQTVKHRYYRWIEVSVLDRMLAALAREADMASMMTDSTLIRAYMHAASERKAKRHPRPWLGRDPGCR